MKEYALDGSLIGDGIDEELEQEKFIEGYKQALRDYAWWKDGVQYVGCGVKTLKIALYEIDSKDKPHE